jgi:Mitochondrial carrier protein
VLASSIVENSIWNQRRLPKSIDHVEEVPSNCCAMAVMSSTATEVPPPPPTRCTDQEREDPILIMEDTTTTNLPIPKQQQQQQQYPQWHTVIAGGMAGFVSRMVTAPLDLIRIRRQLNTNNVTYPMETFWKSWKNIVRNEGGIPALYRGNLSAIYLWIGYAGIQFSVYSSTKDMLRTHLVQEDDATMVTSNDTTNVVVSFCAGGIAGIFATVITYPFDVCRTAFSARGFTSNRTTLPAPPSPPTAPPPPTAPATATVTRTLPPQHPFPFSSLYEPPLFPSSTESSLTTAMRTRTTAEIVTKSIHPTFPIPLSSTLPLSSSAILHSSTNTPIPRTVIEFVQQMYHVQGFRGFYAGASPAIIQIVPYMGLNFAIYDWLISCSTTTSSNTSSIENQASKRNDTKVSIGLSAYAGSLSGALSKMAVYPLDTVKRRLQAQAFFPTSAMCDSVEGRPYHHHHYKGMWDCILTIFQKEGCRSFYRGIVPSVLKTAIATSITFSCFRWTQNTLEWIHDLRRTITTHQ